MKQPSHSHRNILLLITALLWLLPNATQAQFDFPAMGGAAAAMGGATAAQTDFESASDNIALLGALQSAHLTLSIRQQFATEGMGYARFGGAIPVGFGSVGLTALHYGNSDYNELQISGAYGIPLGNNVRMGAGFHYLRSSTSDPYYDPQQLMTFSVALQYSPSERIAIGFSTYNPLAARMRTDIYTRVPARFNLGASYRPVENLTTLVEVEKNLYYDPTLRFGIEYCLQQHYAFRVGLVTHPTIYTFGFGFRQRHIGADLSAQLHAVLGLTPQLNLHYTF